MHRLLILPLVLSLYVVAEQSSPAADKEKPKLAPQLVKLLQGTPAEFIKRFDKNKDGYLTKDELPPRLAPLFDRMDKNEDGKLDKQEVATMMQLLRKRFGITPNAPAKNKGPNQAEVDRLVNSMLQRMDTNKDGKISKAEAQGPLAKGFDRLDTNKDGYLDKQELRRAAQQFLAARKGKASQGLGQGQGQNLVDFDALDKNADGRLSREELKGTPYYEQFDKIDTNKDGKIDKKEFERYLDKQAETAEKKKDT